MSGVYYTVEELVAGVSSLRPKDSAVIGARMKALARVRYTWDIVGQAYFACL